MPELNHQKRILLIEDQEQFYTPITRWLEDKSFHVTHAGTYLEAKTAIHTSHFHLAIVDLNLDNDDPDNEAGFDLLQEVRQIGLHPYMPCIMLTAYGDMRRTLRAFQDLRVAHFITKEAGFRRNLLTAVNDTFNTDIKINFDLEYDAKSTQIMAQIADDVNWSMTVKPDTPLLTMQLLDLFGKLFLDAKELAVSKLKPGLTGAAVIRVQPTWEYGRGTSFVAKVGRDEKVRTEAERYEQYVINFLPPNTIAQVKDVAYTRHVGILLYTFTENDMVPLKEFDEFYNAQDPLTIIQSLRNLFETTCLHWYDDSRSQSERQNLSTLYYDAFRFDEKKLIQRIQVVLPEYDAESPTYQFEQSGIQGINPVYWLNQHQDECELSIYNSITHGDLTGRNIMVDQTNKCWLIDFYRTYDSHIMRDFVILETDIKYRLMPELSATEFLMLEKALLDIDDTGREQTMMVRLRPDVIKATAIINALRSFAIKFASGGESSSNAASRREHLISLLMTTMNVVRLRHVKEERKLQAMLSASLICAELDRVAGREPFYPQIEVTDAFESLAVDELPNSTAQPRYLSKLLAEGKLNLFLGSKASSGFFWPDSLFFVGDLSWQAIFTSNRHTHIEAVLTQQKRPFQLINTHSTDQQPNVLPIYKLYGTKQEENSPLNGQLTQPDHQIIDHLCQAMQNGESLLLLCATESEMMMIYGACQEKNPQGHFWLAGADLPEDKQDSYRSVGFRVLAETPDDILTSLRDI